MLEWLSGPIRPASLVRWATELGWATQPGGIEVSVRYHHPNPVEMRCTAEDGIITFSSDGHVVPIPGAPFQLVEVRRAPRGTTVAEKLASWTGEHVALLPGILGTLVSSPISFFDDARVDQGDVLVQRQGARSFSRYDSLSGGEQTRLRFGLAAAAAGAKAAQAPTILLLDDVLDLADTETAHAIALFLQRPEHRFQTIVTSWNDRILAPDIAWEVVMVHRNGAEPVGTEFMPSSFGGDDKVKSQ